jgi:hypothetical protein
MFMFLVSYIFAIVAVTVFGKSAFVAADALVICLFQWMLKCGGVRVVLPDDPFHFGDLGSAMLTLFRIATQEDWTDIMYFNMFGCDKWGDYMSDVAESTTDCIPESFGTMSPLFFILCATFLLPSLAANIYLAPSWRWIHTFVSVCLHDVEKMDGTERQHAHTVRGCSNGLFL